MSLEHQDADARCGPARGDSGTSFGLADQGGWDLVQRDWSLRQREPSRPRAPRLARLRARIEAAIARAWRVVRVALRGIVAAR